MEKLVVFPLNNDTEILIKGLKENKLYQVVAVSSYIEDRSRLELLQKKSSIYCSTEFEECLTRADAIVFSENTMGYSYDGYQKRVQMALDSGKKIYAGLALLDKIQIDRDAFVSIGVEGIHVDGCPAVYAGINFRAVKDRLSVCIHDARGSAGVCVDEVSVFVCLVIRAFQVSVPERCLEDGEGRYGFSVSFQLGFPFFVGCLDGGFDLVHGCSIRFWDDQADTVLRSATVDGFRFPDVDVAPACVRTSDNLHGICHFCIFTHCHISP